MQRFTLPLGLSLFVSLFLAVQLWAAGRIELSKVVGSVTLLDAAGAQTSGVAGTDVAPGTTLRTGTESQAVLLFSNGATLVVEPLTEMVVREFEQEGRPANPTEPEKGKSLTKLKLVQGKVVGRVNKLNIEQGSRFEVETAVGIAGVRGTVIDFSVSPTEDGQITVSFTVPEGVVQVILNNNTVRDIGIGEGLSSSLQIKADVDPATGEVRILEITGLDLPGPQMAAVIVALESAIREAMSDTAFREALVLPGANDGRGDSTSGGAE